MSSPTHIDAASRSVEPIARAAQAETLPDTRLRAILARRPLAAFFVLAFAGTWLFWLPLALQRETNALGVLPITFPPAVQFVAFMLGVWAGPLLAALTVTAAVRGRPGVRQLLRRCVDWRVGFGWYLLITVGFIPLFLLAFSVVYGVNLGAALLAQPSVLLSTYVAQLVFSLPTANIQEEIGWRGVALPRLQQRYGPIVGTLILGTLHSLWHLPALFTPLLGPTSLPHFAGFLAVGVGTSFVFTWTFNHTRGSVLLAALAHGCLNAAVGLSAALIPAGMPVPGWARPLVLGGWNGDQLLIMGAIVGLLLLLTRGRLGYRSAQIADLLAPPRPDQA